MNVIYDINDVFKVINKEKNNNIIVLDYLENNNWELMMEKKNKNNGILKKSIETNQNKSIITETLNTLNNKNFDESLNTIQNLTFNDINEFEIFVLMFFNKLKKTIKSNKLCISKFCSKIKTLYFINKNEKIFFENILKNHIKNDYDEVMNNFDKDKSNEILSCIAYLYQASFIDLNIMNIIFNDFKNAIEYNEKKTNYKDIENKIDMICYFLNELHIDEKIEFLVNDMKTFLTTQSKNYEKKISLKTEMKILNII